MRKKNEVTEIAKPYQGPYPLSLTHRVRWGDCDPAGIIYTPKVLDYAVELVEVWNREVLGVSWMKLYFEMHMGTPTVRAEVEFLSPPAPDHEIISEIRVEKLGNSSITFVIRGRGEDGTDIYQARLVSCLVSRPAFKAIPFPDDFRACITAYRQACGEPE